MTQSPYGTSSQNVLALVFKTTPPSTGVTGILTVAYPVLVLNTLLKVDLSLT